MKLLLQWIRNSVKGALLIVVAALLVDCLIEQFTTIQAYSKHLLTGCILLIPILIGSGIGLWLIFRSDDEDYLTRVALAIIAVSLVARLIWVFCIDSYQVNDFGEYLNNATDFTDTLWKRAAFYTYPLVLLFGKSLAALKLLNVLLATLTAWVFFLAGRIIAGARVASIGLLFFIWHADLWYSMTLASHDIPGLFWLGLFFYLSALLQRRLLTCSTSWARVAALSVGLGLSVFFLGAVRSYHYGAIVALAGCATVHAAFILFTGARARAHAAGLLDRSFRPQGSTGRRLKLAAVHTVFLLGIPVGVYKCADIQIWKPFKLQFDSIGSGLDCYLTVTNVLGNSENAEINNWYLYQCPEIRNQDRKAFAARKLLHELTHSPGAYLLHLERKNRVLARADAYLGWSTFTTYEPWDATHDQVKHINQFDPGTQAMTIAVANALVVLLVLYRILLYPFRPVRLLEFIPIFFSAIYYSVFLFLLESQSRYNIFLIYVFSWMAAQAIVELHHRSVEKQLPSLQRLVPAFKRLYLGGVVLLVLGLAAYWITSIVVADSSLTLRDQTGFVVAPPRELPPQFKMCAEITPLFMRNNFKQLMVGYPAGTEVQAGSIIAVQRTFTLNQRPQHHLRLFLSTYSARNEPFLENVTWQDTKIEYVVAVNGHVICSGKVNDIYDNEYFSFDSNSISFFAPQMTLQLVLRNVDRIEKVGQNRGPVISLEYIDLQ